MSWSWPMLAMLVRVTQAEVDAGAEFNWLDQLWMKCNVSTTSRSFLSQPRCLNTIILALMPLHKVCCKDTGFSSPLQLALRAVNVYRSGRTMSSSQMDLGPVASFYGGPAARMRLMLLLLGLEKAMGLNTIDRGPKQLRERERS